MTPWALKRILPVACGVLAVGIGLWAGVRVHLRGYVSDQAAMQVPRGEPHVPLPAPDGIEGESDPAIATAAKIPDRLPNFSLRTPAGTPTAISAWAGQSLLLNFWATWCAPCRREIPLLKVLNREWSGRGLSVIGVAVDDREKVAAYAGAMQIAYPLLVGEQDALDVALKFGVETPVFPFSVFTDRRGEVVALYVGELHRPQADLILSVIQRLNDNRVELAQARQAIASGLRAEVNKTG